MAEKFYPNQDESYEKDPIGSFFAEWIDPEDEGDDWGSDFFEGTAGRRKKAAFVLMFIWLVVIGLHFVSWGYNLVLIITSLAALHIIKLFFAQNDPVPVALTDQDLTNAPTISLLVAAKNEEAVITRAVKLLCNLDYPLDKFEVWAIDDNSSDRTGEILDQLTQEYSQLKVFHRSAKDTGGKSGALNQVLLQTKGEIIAVFDADEGDR